MSEQVRVRFAPSPTGPFHIGGARSALFNWLVARKNGGKFVLRIEDTDLDRSTKESEENIKEALRWLGLTWDEGADIGGPYAPYRQTERLDIYRQYTDKLLESGQVYHCFCTEEELEAERQLLLAEGKTPCYQGRCRSLSEADKIRLAGEGRKPAIRFRVPENQQIAFKDLVRDTVSFDSNGIGDFVIVKSDGIPVYNYAVVIDDAAMEITHVIRAEEHLSNTPRQVLLYQALGLPVPKFGHISLILGQDRSKMSKRHGATSVEQYRKLGYLPEALVNFLALLGWAPAGEQEIFTLEELVENFSLDRVAKNPAVFDIDKLNWINAHYLKQLTPPQLAELVFPHLEAAGYIDGSLNETARGNLIQFLEIIQEQLSYAAQAVEHVDVYFNDQVEFESEEARQVLLDADIPLVMQSFKEKLAALEELSSGAVQTVLKSITKELKIGGKKVYMPVRVAITGKMHGPDLGKLITIIGKERTLQRLNATLAKFH
ncbi:glutamate--tRNA ligase|uniref:Glutamate--tRNA ligase n=1 Tax=Dendrosporobacter quercicolus TaxID=146817 RepID=A0A1G9V3E7_9FIRM|nr:glutamate--tRNA ligase [Dendrosporobacter quercicolus]NSL47937.1 glutamate--tRNA ligase [Dendrosporobacter quercicolus DSM 1736]SDM66668.1 nondiscriminating glutamyl-tRNA synthetase [Dendrosporobacter quercicolus]